MEGDIYTTACAARYRSGQLRQEQYPRSRFSVQLSGILGFRDSICITS
jgi:hypothetical protein